MTAPDPGNCLNPALEMVRETIAQYRKAATRTRTLTTADAQRVADWLEYLADSLDAAHEAADALLAQGAL